MSRPVTWVNKTIYFIGVEDRHGRRGTAVVAQSYRPGHAAPGQRRPGLAGDRWPTLGRPIVDRIQGSRVHHLKELRPGSAGASEIRILFPFDPATRAVLLVAGDKAGDW